MGNNKVNLSGEASNDDVIIDSFNVKKQRSDFLSKAMDITNLNEKKLAKIEKQSDSQSDIIKEILKQDSKNVELAQVALRNDPWEFYKSVHPVLLSSNKILETLLISDIDFLNISKIKEKVIVKLANIEESKSLVQIIFKNFIKQKKSGNTVREFISEVAGTNKQLLEKLQEIYKTELKKVGRIYENDLKKSTELLQHSPEIIDLLVAQGVIKNNGEINKNYFIKLEAEIQDNFSNNNIDNNNKNILDFLINTLNILPDMLGKEVVSNFLNSLVNSLNIKSILKDGNIGNEAENQENLDDHGEDDIDSSDEELLDFCAPYCNLTSLGGYYTIENKYSSTIKIAETEYKKFSSTGLENYIKFNEILSNIGLAFLLQDKNKIGFIQLLRDKLDGFEYTAGEGFSPKNITKTLSLVANLLGVPKFKYGGASELGEFQDSQEAIRLFTNIESTGMVNGEKKASTGGMFNPGVTQTLLLRKNILNQNGGLNSVKSKEILATTVAEKDKEKENSTFDNEILNTYSELEIINSSENSVKKLAS